MLDSVTKKRINDLRDILVGRIPDPKSQVEQITTGLIYKFMHDLDRESVAMGGNPSFFVGEYEKYSWEKLMDKKLGGAEKVQLYSEAIEKMYTNPTAPPLFREIFKNSFLPFKDPQTLNLFLKVINEFEYSHSEKLGDAFEYLLSTMDSQGDVGQFRTPRHIIDFIVAIVSPKKNERILDPACGTAGFLISSYKHILAQNQNKRPGDKLYARELKTIGDNLYGYDISPDMTRLSLVNMYLHQFATPHIYEYDTLSSEDKWGEYYNVILANPPFFSPKGGITPHSRFGVKSTRAEVLFVDYMMQHLLPNGRAGFIVPEGIIFQAGTAYKALRKKLIEECLLGVVSLPTGVFNPYSGVKTSILILDKELSKKADGIFFAKIENDGFSLGARRTEIAGSELPATLNKIRDWMAGKHDVLDTIAKSQILENADYSLAPSRYLNKESVTSNFPMVKLGSISEFVRGVTFAKKDQLAKPSETSCKVVTTKAAQENGIVINACYFIESNLVKNKQRFLKKDDILISLANSLDLVGRTTFVKENHKNLAFGAFMGVIRPHTNEVHPIFLHNILRSAVARNFYRTHAKTTTNISNLSFSTLAEFSFPLPPLAIQQEIVAELDTYQNLIDGCRQVIANYKPTLTPDPSWEMVELGEVLKTASGGTPKTSKSEYYKNGTIPWMKSGEVGQGFIYDIEEKITDEGLKNSSAKVFPVDTVCIALYGATAGKVGILKVESSTNQAVCGIFPSEDYVPEFLYYFLKSKTDDFVKQSVGGAQPNISHAIVKKTMIPKLAKDKQAALVKNLQDEHQIIEGNKKLIESYTQKIQDRISKIWEKG